MPDRKRKSALKPLEYPVFRYLWLATVASNIGTWMQNISAAWVMTSLTSSSLMVAMLQAATSLPMVFFSIPAGAIADIVDRRKLMLINQIIMVFIAVILTAIYFSGHITPWLLLLFTFAIGCCTALNAPAWFSTTPELVPAEDLSEAVTLNGIGVNSARAIGPAIAGVVISLYSPGFAFALNALSFVGLIFALLRWKNTRQKSTFPSETFGGSIKAGIRYVRQSQHMHNIFLHAGGFFVFASSIWALMPLIARNELHLHATGYGVLLTSMGLGSIIIAFILPAIRSRMTRNKIIMLASLIYAGGVIILSGVPSVLVANIALFMIGMAWIAVVSSLHVTAQTSSASWVRARALSVYLVILSGGMGFGSIIWGNIAEFMGVPDTLFISGIGMIAVALILARVKLHSLTNSDFEAAPVIGEVIKSFGDYRDEQPVMISVEYIIAEGERENFLKTISKMEAIRRRDGAVFWGVAQGVEEKDRYVEYFLVETWLEHLRQHERTTKSDRKMQEKISSFHKADKPPKVSHLIMQVLN